MTIEEKFFKTFGIEPNIIGCNTGFYDFYRGFRYSCDATNCKKCKSAKKVYPEITAEILLELIRIMNIYQEKSLVYGQTKRELQEDILNRVMLMRKKGLGIKREVRKVFEEQNENTQD